MVPCFWFRVATARRNTWKVIGPAMVGRFRFSSSGLMRAMARATPLPALMTLEQVAETLAVCKAWLRDHSARRNLRLHLMP